MPISQELGNGLDTYDLRKISLSATNSFNYNNGGNTAPDSGSSGWRRGKAVAAKAFRKKSGFGLSFDLDSISESIQGKFYNSDLAGSDEGCTIPLITKLDKYTSAELREYRQVFNMFDAGQFL